MNKLNITKRFLSLILAIMMVLGSFSLAVFADEEDVDTTVGTDDAEITDTEENAEDADSEEEDGKVKPEDIFFKNYLAPDAVYGSIEEKLANMEMKYEAYGYQLYYSAGTGEVALKNVATGEVLFTNPYDLASSASSEEIKQQLISQLLITYVDSSGADKSMNSCYDAAIKSQIRFKGLKNGIRVEYSIGEEETRYLVPMLIEKSRFEEQILNNIASGFQANKIASYYTLIDLNDEKLQDSVREKYQQQYPIAEKMAIYVFDTSSDESDRSIGEVEDIIKEHCPKYNFAALEEDHSMTGYTSVKKAPPLFKMALEYILDENGLSIRLPANSIRYDEDEYTLTSVKVLPYLGAGSNEQAGGGYSFYPDGSGALFDFQQLKGTSLNIKRKMYGEDYAYHEIASGALKTETLRMPVYGVVEHYAGQSAVVSTKLIPESVDEEGNVIPAHEETVAESYTPVTMDRGFLAIIEEGDSMASLIAASGGTQHRYNSVYAEYSPKASDTYNLSDAVAVGDDTDLTIFADNKYTGSYRMRIVMLTDKAKAEENGIAEYYPVSYMGMAKAYRDYLIEKEVLVQKEENEKDIPLYIESFGAVETDGTFLSVPVTVYEALTTFEDLKTMSGELNEKGINNVNFRLTGFVNGGMKPGVPTEASFEKAVGGDKGYTEFVKYAKEKGITLYPEFDLSYVGKDESFDGYKAKNDAAKAIDERYTTQRRYYSSYQQSMTTGLVNVSPAAFPGFYDKVTEDLTKLGKSGISLSTLGTDLNSDFDDDDFYDREDSKSVVSNLLETANKDYDSVMVDGGNAFTWKYADVILNAPLDSSHYTKANRSVPFMGLVLHGFVDFAGDPTNMASDSGYEKLKMIENGSDLYFTLSYQNTPLLKDDKDLAKYYSVEYDIWFEDLVEIYTELNEVTKDLRASAIVNHEFLSGVRVAEAAELEADKMTVAEYVKAGLTEEEAIAAVNVKYAVTDGTLVRVTYENGTQFILNYNRYDVTVEGYTIEALDYVRIG